MSEPNYDHVICPNCVYEFQATPVNVQERIKELEAERYRLREALEKIKQHQEIIGGFKINQPIKSATWTICDTALSQD